MMAHIVFVGHSFSLVTLDLSRVSSTAKGGLKMKIMNQKPRAIGFALRKRVNEYIVCPLIRKDPIISPPFLTSRHPFLYSLTSTAVILCVHVTVAYYSIETPTMSQKIGIILLALVLVVFTFLDTVETRRRDLDVLYWSLSHHIGS